MRKRSVPSGVITRNKRIKSSSHGLWVSISSSLSLSHLFFFLFLLSKYVLSTPLFFMKIGLLRTISKLARKRKDNDKKILAIGVHKIPIKE